MVDPATGQMLVTVPVSKLIALCVLCGGEEMSWGQRLLHFQTPAALAANKQHEANLHDIGSISVSENAFFVFTTVCCLVVP